MKFSPLKDKKRIITIVLVVIGVTSVSFFSSKSPNPEPHSVRTQDTSAILPEKHRNAVWVWDSPSKINLETFEKQLQFAQAKHIKIVYLYLEDYLTLKDGKQKDDPATLAAYSKRVKEVIGLAKKYDIEVHALAGATNWADSSHHYLAPLLLEYVIAFNRTPGQTEKFTGVQFDIEFYNDKNYRKNRQQASVNYLNLVSRLAQTVQVDSQNSLSLGFAIPYGFDDGRGNVPKITYRGEKKALLSHLLDTLDGTNAYLAVMAYRNRVHGNNGIVRLSEGDIALADTKGGRVKIVIGIETEKNKTGVTFHRQKQARVNQATHDIAEAFADSPSFAGIAIHTLKGYENLPAD